MGLFEPKNAVKPDADAFTDSMRKHDPRSPASPRKRLRGGVQSPLSPKRLLNKLRKPQKPGRLEPPTPIAGIPIEEQWLHIYSPTKSPLPNRSAFKASDFVISDRCLGQGAFASVKLASHKQTGKRIAVKEITKSGIPDGMSEYVVGEAHILARLHDKNIVKLLLTDEDEDHIYLYLQFMEGGDLHSRVERDGNFIPAHAKHVFRQIVNAVDYCHKQNICHRDLKLENILIQGEGLSSKVLLIDFGFAADMPTQEHLFTDFPGSVCYAAPELIQGRPYRGRSADIYSLGVVLYTMLFGRYPFYSENKRDMFQMITGSKPTFPEGTDPQIKALLTWMLMKEPSLRPTMAEIRNHAWLAPRPQAQKGDKFASAAVDAIPGLAPFKTKVDKIKDEVERLSKDLARLSMSPPRSRRHA